MESYGESFLSHISQQPLNLTLSPQRFGKENFQEAMKISNRMDADRIDWSRFKYMVFDIPTHKGSYEERFKDLGNLLPNAILFSVLRMPPK